MKNILVGIFLVTSFIFLIFVLVKKPIYSTYTPQNDSLSAEKLTALVNKWRVESGFKPYEISEGLCKIAIDRSKDKIDKHVGFYERYSNYRSIITENLSVDFTNQKTLEGWLASPPHRKALEHDYKYSCIATQNYNAVQIFSNCENGCY